MNTELFFEAYSPIQVICYFKEIRQSKGIFFLERIYPPIHRVLLGDLRKRVSLFLIKRINPNITFKRIPIERLRKYNWLSNQEALIRVKENELNIKKKPLISNLISFFEDENISNFYLSQYVQLISEKIMFESLSKDFQDGSQDTSFLCIPHSNTNNLFFNDCWRTSEIKDKFCLERMFLIGCNFFYYLISITSPLIFILLNIWKIRIRIDLKEYSIKSPIIWGLSEANLSKRVVDDSLLYGDKIVYGAIIHVNDYKKWKIEHSVLESTKNFCLNKGCGYIDSRKYKINFHLIINLIKKFPKILAIFKGVSISRSNTADLMSVFIILQTAFEQQKEFSNVNYKVEFVRDDYNRRHIVRSVVNKKFGKFSIGTQHHIHVMDYPSLSFKYLDKYLTYSEHTSNCFMPYWEEGITVKTGRPSVDGIIRLSKEIENADITKEKIKDIFKDYSRLILITLPSGVKKNSTNSWNELRAGIEQVLAVDRNCSFFLKFKERDHILAYENCKRFADWANETKRVKVVEDDFSTYELILASDLVICGGSSSVLVESLAVNKKCYCFRFVGNEEFYYPNFGNDLIIDSGEKLFKTIQAYLNNEEDKLEVYWDKLKDSVNHFSDGKNKNRIQNAFYEHI